MVKTKITDGCRADGSELNEILSKLSHLILETLHEADDSEFGGRVVGERVPSKQTEVRCDCNDVTCGFGVKQISGDSKEIQKRFAKASKRHRQFTERESESDYNHSNNQNRFAIRTDSES